MVEDDKRTKSLDSSKEINELLKEFYLPEDEPDEFTTFFCDLETKLQDQDPGNKINKSIDSIENSYLLRQEKLEKIINRLEKGEFDAEVKKTKPSSRPKFKKLKTTALVSSLLLALTLAGIASFKKYNKYNFISPDNANVEWRDFDLTHHQEQKLAGIESNYNDIFSREGKFIDEKKSALEDEINKEKPDFGLIDQYHRQILDHEVILKREQLNSFLEKRFILNEKQSLKLIRELK